MFLGSVYSFDLRERWLESALPPVSHLDHDMKAEDVSATWCPSGECEGNHRDTSSDIVEPLHQPHRSFVT